MQNNQSHFLDKQTLMALGVLIAVWMGWSYYMKQRYSPQPPTAPVIQAEDEKPAEESPKTKKPRLALKEHKEQTLEFKGENMDIVFSSKGFGIKKIVLKAYSNREKEPVTFYHPEKPLFSTVFFNQPAEPMPFKIKREGNAFVGVFSSAEGRIKKTVEVNEKDFILNSRVEIEPVKNQKHSFEGYSLQFSHALPKNKDMGILNMLFIYGQDLLKAFVSYEGGENKRLNEEDLEKEKDYSKLSVAAIGGRYFGKAFINNSEIFPSLEFTKNSKEAGARLDYRLLSSKKQSLKYQAFIGPKSLKSFRKMNNGIELWLDFGFFGWLARPLLLFLNWLYSWCANWGLAIILLTLVMRAGLLPINLKSYKSMKVMQKIQPRIKELKESHKSDPKKMNMEVMALMKKHKANPLGGCLPLFIQFPVFFALYRVLGESIELYQSPFVFWIQDLSMKDPSFVLPVLAGLVLFIQQKITPMSIPKEQARLLMAMPILFSVFMLALPSGLTLYIFVSGLFGLVQQFFFVKLGSDYLKGGEHDKTV